MEYREFRAGSVDEADDGKLILRAAPFSSLTTIGDKKRGGWDEEIAPGCFAKALREGDTVLLADHDMAKPISRMSAGTLRLVEGRTHLEGDADPVDTSYVRDLRANIKAGNKGGMSIGFVPVKDEWFDDEGRPSNRMVGTRRVLREVKLPEVSIVTNPAYKDTSVMARDELLAEREARAERAEGTLDDPDGLLDQAAILLSLYNELNDEGRAAVLGELYERRASDISADGRKKLAAKGHALPDGSYPIPDKSHLHAAAVLAASGHGDVAAAKALIRRRAKELGVDVKTLPGFGGDKRDDSEPDGHWCTKTCCDEGRSEQEPDASTPEDDDADFALRVAWREAEERSRKLGYV